MREAAAGQTAHCRCMYYFFRFAVGSVGPADTLTYHIGVKERTQTDTDEGCFEGGNRRYERL